MPVQLYAVPAEQAPEDRLRLLAALGEAAQGAPLSDVRADLHQTGILIWREECLVITARTQ